MQLQLPEVAPLGTRWLQRYRYKALPDCEITFGATVLLRDGRRRFYPLGFPRNERSVVTASTNGADGFDTLDEAIAWHFRDGDLDELERYGEREEVQP